jgi:hypothetical protein
LATGNNSLLGAIGGYENELYGDLPPFFSIAVRPEEITSAPQHGWQSPRQCESGDYDQLNRLSVGQAFRKFLTVTVLL